MLKRFGIPTVKRTAACLGIALCLAASVAAPAGAQNNRLSVSLENNSSYDIYQIFMSSTSNGYWGRDLLGSYGILRTGESFGITADPGGYDLKLVDEDGDNCVVKGLTVYRQTAWNINDRWLLSCEFHR